jgi:hypothetical protein
MGSERVEIITRAERRRRWSMADKLDASKNLSR